MGHGAGERDGALRGDESFVYDVAFSPDGVYIASAAWDNSVRFWDVTTGIETALFKGPGRRDPSQRRAEQGSDASIGAPTYFRWH